MASNGIACGFLFFVRLCESRIWFRVIDRFLVGMVDPFHAGTGRFVSSKGMTRRSPGSPSFIRCSIRVKSIDRGDD